MVIQTNNRKILLTATATAKTYAWCNVILIDEDKNTLYGNYQLKWPVGKNTYQIPMPVTPQKVTVKIENKPIFDILISHAQLITLPLPVGNIVADYIEWIVWFCKNASILAYKQYNMPNRSFHINYMHQIIHPEYGVLQTPARIHELTDEIQIAGIDFKRYSFTARLAVTLHEFYHNYRNTDNETEADLAAVSTMRYMGYSAEQIMESFLEFLSNSKENKQRITEIYNYLF